jgi:hypothetical protein
MSDKLKPPPLPPRKAPEARGNPKATQEVNPGQILSEEPALEALAEPYAATRQPAPPSAANAISEATLEVESVQVVSERPASTVRARVLRESAVYARVDREVPLDGLSHDEGMLLSVVDGHRDVNVIGSISGIEVGEVQRVLDGLERRSLLIRRS